MFKLSFSYMQTGRKPSGLCGAAIYVAALSEGVRFPKSEIVSITMYSLFFWFNLLKYNINLYCASEIISLFVWLLDVFKMFKYCEIVMHV